jgi:glycosyltransferase involved in cell wall biosynthesis
VSVPILSSSSGGREGVEKQRILFVSSSLGVSGAEVVLINLLRTMDKERFEVSVFCNVENLLLVERLQNLAIEFKTSSRFPDPERIGKSGLAFSKVFAYTSSIFRVGTELISYLRKRPFDLIHANGYPDCLYCLLPAWTTRIPLTWHLHDMRPVHRKNVWVYRLAGRLSAKIIAVSEACRLNILKSRIPPSKVITIYNGIDLRQFKEGPNGHSVRKELGIDSGAKVIGLFGQPLPEKGHSYFIEAAAEVVKLFPGTRFGRSGGSATCTQR